MRGEGIYNADGLSTTDYKFLVKELGEKYAKRFTSAQDLIVDFRGGDDPQQALNRDELVTAGDLPAQHACLRGLHSAGDLICFHVQQLVAGLYRTAFLDLPVDHPAFGHGQAPFGHGDRVYQLVRHGLRPYATRLRAASVICAVRGM